MATDIVQEIIDRLDTPFRRRARDIVVNSARYGFITGSKLTAARISKGTGLSLHDVELVLVGEPNSEAIYNEVEDYVLGLLSDAKKTEIELIMEEASYYDKNMNDCDDFLKSLNEKNDKINYQVDKVEFKAIHDEFVQDGYKDYAVSDDEPKPLRELVTLPTVSN